MTDDSLDYIFNPDAPADWFVKFPLKVSCPVEVMPYSEEGTDFAHKFYFLKSRNVLIFMDCHTPGLLIGQTFKRFSLMNAEKSTLTLFKMETL